MFLLHKAGLGAMPRVLADIFSSLRLVFLFLQVVWELLTSEVPFKGLEGIQVAWVVVAHKEVSCL